MSKDERKVDQIPTHSVRSDSCSIFHIQGHCTCKVFLAGLVIQDQSYYSEMIFCEAQQQSCRLQCSNNDQVGPMPVHVLWTIVAFFLLHEAADHQNFLSRCWTLW